MHSRSFMCEITVYPDFNRGAYSGYIKEQFNKWITECFRTYTASFSITCEQHGQQSYRYDSEQDTKDIAFKKLWQNNQFGSYTITIKGEGLVMQGAKQMQPPMSIADEMVDKIAFRYAETSDGKPPILVAYGKGIGLPSKHTVENTGAEEWGNGFSESDMYCPMARIEAECTKGSFDKMRDAMQAVMDISSGSREIVDADKYGLDLSVEVPFHLRNKDKAKMLSALNRMCAIATDEDPADITEFSMDFIASDGKFSLESYLYDEASGKIAVKNISV